ncbi:hypothetical protein [Chryseobacterium sp. M5A1_1a]
MKLSENKVIGKIGYFSPIFKYVGIIFTWIQLINDVDPKNFLSLFEKKIGLEIFLLSINFFLIGLGQNTKAKKDFSNFKVYIIIFSLFSIGSVIAVWNDTQLLISVIVIMFTNLMSFMGQSGEYGATGNDIFMSGRGSVFCFVLAVMYGIPIGLILKHFNLGENVFILGYSIAGYYIILLFFEIRYLLKNKI